MRGPIDTKRYLVLFDGLRAHAVTPFEGERYSLVFFTANHYDRARPTVVKALVGSGAEWPNYASLKYYAQLIGPPKGYVAPSQSILRFLGRSEREPMLKWIGRTLLTLGEDIVAEALSYVLRPRVMPDICAVCRGLAGAAWAPTPGQGPSSTRRRSNHWVSVQRGTIRFGVVLVSSSVGDGNSESSLY